MGHPKIFYELHFCEKMKNEAKTGLRGEQGGDEVSCKHAYTYVMQLRCNLWCQRSLRFFYFNFGINNKNIFNLQMQIFM